MALDCNRDRFVLRDSRTRNHYHGRCTDVLPGMDCLRRNRSVDAKNRNKQSNIKQCNEFLSPSPNIHCWAGHHNMYRVEARIEKLPAPTHKTQFNFISIQNTDGEEKFVFFFLLRIECVARHSYAI